MCIGYGDDPEDPVIPVPSLPPHLTEFTRRKSKVDVEVLHPSPSPPSLHPEF